LQSDRWRIQFIWIAILLGLAINPIRALLALLAQMLVGGGLEALEGRAESLPQVVLPGQPLLSRC
jgi:hypothetical protein